MGREWLIYFSDIRLLCGKMILMNMNKFVSDNEISLATHFYNEMGQRYDSKQMHACLELGLTHIS
jgi:hypothetical protein